MQALQQQAQEMAAHPWTRAREFHSLYIGGRTPSTVDTSAMDDVVTICLEAFDSIVTKHVGVIGAKQLELKVFVL